MIVIIMKYNMYIYMIIIEIATTSNGYPMFLWISQAKTIGT